MPRQGKVQAPSVAAGWRLVNDDMRKALVRERGSSVDACVTDPPYGLEFMGKEWDHGVPGVYFWKLVLRVLKPGAYLLAFGGTRTYHRLACAIEDAGFELRDCLAWMYGQGFPKSKGCLKPAWEPILLARRPAYGVDDLPGLDECRVGVEERFNPPAATAMMRPYESKENGRPAVGRWPANVILEHLPTCRRIGTRKVDGVQPRERSGNRQRQSGFALTDGGGGYAGPDGKETVEAWECAEGCPARMLDEQSGQRASRRAVLTSKPGTIYGAGKGLPSHTGEYGFDDFGGASRFFYCPKASRSERNLGLDGMEPRTAGVLGLRQGEWAEATDNATEPAPNHHPTVKPVAVCRWLCRLVCPRGGVVLDPFAGSGTTGVACAAEGLNFLGVEADTEHGYFEIATRRVRHAYGGKGPMERPGEEPL